MYRPEAAVLEKRGPELFRELLRIYPVAEVDDYYRGGQWREDLMRADLHLIHAHRREAGAPDPVPLDKVKMPPMPAQYGGSYANRPVAKPKAGTPVKAGSIVASSGAPSPQVELRLIALFCAKWKLDASKAKLVLARLTPPRRRYVIQNFKPEAPGPGANAALEEYIKECDESGVWDTAASSSAKASGDASEERPGNGSAGGVKRPSYPSTASQPATKQPRTVGAIAPSALPSTRSAPSVGGYRPSSRPSSAPSSAMMAPSAKSPPSGGSQTVTKIMKPTAKGAKAPPPKASGDRPGDMIKKMLEGV